ncbi:MAG: phenylacetate-CoA oxygenase subunit PaaJ [Xanthomonadales bacterium]|nr:phenylacetate-CoA oxygenase subunit PaaJ [Xanthomonadales bacterium]
MSWTPPAEGAAEEVWNWLAAVKDPEIPVLTIADLGILRQVTMDGDHCVVTITPTYSGCPAMNTIEQDVLSVLAEHNVEATVETLLDPPWTTDWMSEDGRRKLEAYGIAPPAETSASKRAIWGEDPTVCCPRCKSESTRKVSEFGSTACKALYQCQDCQEPFDYFKCI